MTIYRFDQNDSAPTGDFLIWADDVTVHGTRHRPEHCLQFIQGVLRAKRRDDAFGVHLLREPTNPHDKLAVAVHGFWFDGEHSQVRHLGYVPRKLAFKISLEFDEQELIRATLSGFRRTDEGFDILIHILEEE